MAVVPLVVVTACFTPRYFANRSSKSPMYLPAELIQPDSIASETYSLASFVMTGSFTGTDMGFFMLRAEGFGLLIARERTLFHFDHAHRFQHFDAMASSEK